MARLSDKRGLVTSQIQLPGAAFSCRKTRSGLTRPAEIGFRVQILAGDPLHKLIQIIFLAQQRLDDDAAGFLAHAHRVI